jgi:hypothetical protein
MEPGKVVSTCHVAGRNLTFEFHDYRPLTAEEMRAAVAIWLGQRKNRRAQNKKVIGFTLFGAQNP